MNKNILKSVISVFLSISVCIQAFCCTSIIVSGQATKDGRPLIFKNRDTEALQNMMIFVQGERYKYIGLVNAEDTAPVNVWGGHNEKGFAIINTAAYNLNGDEGDSHGDGLLMRRALELCATLADFEHLLDTMTKPRDTNSNFGVLDALGGCAYYETGNHTYVKFNVNDPAIAPNGYLMRTNFGTTGNHDLDQGVERYQAITDFMNDVCHTKRFEHDYLATAIPRYLRHGLTKMDMNDFMPENEQDSCMFPIGDYIARYSTASALLIQGVRQGETPLNTISWTIIGWPLSTVCIPLKMTSSGKLPNVIGNNGTGHAALNSYGLQLKGQAFCLKRGNMKSYINLAKLLNKQGTGILQKIQPIEQEIIKRGNSVIASIRKQQASDKEMEEYYNWVDEYVTESYQKLMNR